MSRPASRNADRARSTTHSRSTSRRSSTANSAGYHSHPSQPDPYSFCNSFWGDSGYDVLQSKIKQTSKMLDDLRAWYRERAAIEDDYSKRLAKLAKSPLLEPGSHLPPSSHAKSSREFEVGGMRRALEVVRETTRQSAHSHSELAGTIRTALEKRVVEFMTRRDGLKKNPQSQIERLNKRKVELMDLVEKARRRYEADAVAVNGLSAQTHLVQGRDYDKVVTKLDKARQNVQLDEREYRSHVKNLKETIGEWNVHWKSYCDLAQDLEEDRIDFVRTSFWDYANGVSTICVVDDEQCEIIRKALERCETAHDLIDFVRHARTGNDIHAAPDYVNYAKGEQTPYARPQSTTANFVRSSTRNPRAVPPTTSIQDLAQAIRSGPSSPTDPIHPTSVRSSSKATVKRGGAIADTVAANSFAGDPAPSSLAPRSSISRSSIGNSISRAASPAEAMAQVVGGSTNGSVSSRTSTIQTHASNTSSTPVLPAQVFPSSYFPSPLTGENNQYNTTGPNYHDTPPAPPAASTKPINRYAPSSQTNTVVDSQKHQNRTQPSSSSELTHSSMQYANNNTLPAPSNRPASRTSTTGSVRPPSIPAENGEIHPLQAALDKLRTTPSTGSFRRSPVPATSPARGPKPAQSVMPPFNTGSRKNTLDQPASSSNHDQYKRASSPAPSAVMMRPPSDMRSNGGGRTPSPQPHDRTSYHQHNISRGPSPAPPNPPSVQMPYPQPHSQQPQQQQQHHAQARPQSYSAHSNVNPAVPAAGMDPNASHSSRHQQQIRHQHSHSQTGSMMTQSASPASYTGDGSQLPFRHQHQQMSSNPAPQHHPPPASSQSGYGGRPLTQHYGYGQPPPNANQPPPSAPTPVPVQQQGSYVSQGGPPPMSNNSMVHSQSHYSLPPSQSFSSHPYYSNASTPGPNNQPPPNGVHRAPSVYGGNPPPPSSTPSNNHRAPSVYGGNPPPPSSTPSNNYYPNNPAPAATPQPQVTVPQQQAKGPSPTGNYTESGLPILFYVRALYDYQATMPEEFSFQANDVIAITATDPDGWWQGELLDEFRRGKTGGGNVLPSNFVDLLN